jgi:hypothetical protein
MIARILYIFCAFFLTLACTEKANHMVPVSLSTTMVVFPYGDDFAFVESRFYRVNYSTEAYTELLRYKNELYSESCFGYIVRADVVYSGNLSGQYIDLISVSQITMPADSDRERVRNQNPIPQIDFSRYC